MLAILRYKYQYRYWPNYPAPVVETGLQWLAEMLGLDLKGCYNGNKSIANTVFNVHGCHAWIGIQPDDYDVRSNPYMY